MTIVFTRAITPVGVLGLPSKRSPSCGGALVALMLFLAESLGLGDRRDLDL